VILALTLVCWSVRVEAGLESFRDACSSWSPHVATIKSVRWCREEECEAFGLTNTIGEWFEKRREIVVLAGYDWPGGRDGLRLTLAHEVGHALGLAHSREGIMKKDWEPPVADGPAKKDFESLK